MIRDLRYEIIARLIVMNGGELEVECEPGVDLRSLNGARIAVDLRLDGVGGGRLQFRGRVIRIRPETSTAVIAAAEIPPEFAAVIEANLARPEDRTCDHGHRRSVARRTRGKTGVGPGEEHVDLRMGMHGRSQ